MVALQPACRRTIGVEVVTGEELIRLLSVLRAKLPLTLISQLQPPASRLIQQPPPNLEENSLMQIIANYWAVNSSYEASKLVTDVPMLYV